MRHPKVPTESLVYPACVLIACRRGLGPTWIRGGVSLLARCCLPQIRRSGESSVTLDYGPAIGGRNAA